MKDLTGRLARFGGLVKPRFPERTRMSREVDKAQCLQLDDQSATTTADIGERQPASADSLITVLTAPKGNVLAPSKKSISTP
jgi:hypothetical protein